MRNPEWALSSSRPLLAPPAADPRHRLPLTSPPESDTPDSLFTRRPDKGKAREIDMPHARYDHDELRSRRRARPRTPQPPHADVKEHSRVPARPRSLSRRRYRLPSRPVDGNDACCCCDADAAADLFDADTAAGRLSARARVTTPPRSRLDSRRESGSSDETGSSLGSSATSFVPSLSPSSSRSRLFDDDDGEDFDESPRSFSPRTPSSFASSLQRKTSISKAATSDPLLSPSPSPAGPTFSVGKGRSRRGRWVPAPSEPTSLECTCAPELPDIVRATTSPSPPTSPPRPATSPSSRPSLLTKSLRSLSRLPNLTLPDLLPRLPAAESYLISRAAPSSPAPELAALPPGWGPAERRRVLAAEPSHAADEARGFVLSLALRSAAPFSLRRGFPPALPSAAVAVVDEVEAAAVAPHGMAMQDLSAGTACTSEEAAPGAAALPASPSDDVPPLSPAPSALGDPFSPVPVVAAGTPAPDTQAQAQQALPAARYISNPRHLLQLAIEFEMMRHAKIRGPLRQRAVIVRQATSPPRYGDGAGARERSRLCEEVGA
ncbi:hypothetical protein JCM10450v2_003016 [Rhodotorula kratochvilovae]